MLPIRSGHCQNTKFSRSRHWKLSRLADDDLPPSPEKNQQARTHKTQVWPRKAERSQRVGSLPSYDRQEVCTSHYHEQQRYRHIFNDHRLQHSSNWNSQWHHHHHHHHQPRDVVFPLLPLSALSSSPFHCAMQDGFGKTLWTGDMTIPLQFESLYDWSGGLRVVRLPAGSWHELSRWWQSLYEMGSTLW